MPEIMLGILVKSLSSSGILTQIDSIFCDSTSLSQLQQIAISMGELGEI